MTVRDLDRRLDVPAADDELTRLIVTFNEMLARVEHAVAELVNFTAEAAHELRTPVTLVRTTADVALSKERSADEYRAALADVVAHTEQMTTLVGDLLDLARADTGALPADAFVDLCDVTARAARQMAPAMAGRGLRFTVDSGRPPLMVRGDADSLRRVVVILLDNARKYSRDHGPVGLAVRVDRDANRGRVEIVDEGIGIAPEDRGRVFDRFYRSPTARAHAAEGSGLGLSIARLIVLRYGGAIAIEARPGGGCAVTVDFPLVDSRAAACDSSAPACDITAPA
jgi:signal transduction histidine kinase